MKRLSTRTLTRTLWLRQQLVPGQRSVDTVPAVVAHLVGLQAQDNLPPYLALSARIDGFVPADLSDLLGARQVVRILSLRGTVHVLDAEDALPVRAWVQPALDRQNAASPISRPAQHLTQADLDTVLRPFLGTDGQSLEAVAERLTEAFPEVPPAAAKHLVRGRLAVVQTPPRGQWKRSGGVAYAYADSYLGRDPGASEPADLVLRYLAAYGPATAADMTAWSAVTRLGPVFATLAKEGRLVTYADGQGRTLYDVPGAPIAEEDLPLPVRLLGKYDNVFLAHAARDRIAPEPARKRWMGPNGGNGATLFVDGLLAGLWRVDQGRISLEPFSPLPVEQEHEVAAEIERVETFLATGPDGR